MKNLDNYYNLYVSLSEASYIKRPINFSNDFLTKKQRIRLEEGRSVKFHYPNAKDAHGNDASTVYLQPDNAIKTIKEKNWVGREKVYKKGLLT
ncbi:hypothetical protein IGL46_000692 [Enterococcus sp. DIV1347a]|uniref:hypothetical protein n=1 Tax=Enterococcus faecalis TaxID=1351 RepID=UPI000CF2B973|nr:hypothetical protein [Enterococcus faecalis]MBP4092191.1 hypothetical protein [Enterococcus faecalis]MBP4103410.1 hypothetical protein [Enterococcus faecalis]NSV54460.1 hypothetical protein [Enterococcus faecalis]NSV83847.1 hypothetical protein [Enterococcus faecalis]PQE36359.1 hypothetical protein CUS33_06565 [Enterococcus faecalis]